MFDFIANSDLLVFYCCVVWPERIDTILMFICCRALQLNSNTRALSFDFFINMNAVIHGWT